MRAVSLIHPRLFAEAPAGKFPLNELWRKAEAKGRLFGIEHDGLCYHLSTPEDLRLANIDMRQYGLGERPDQARSPSHPAK
jgi:MurNAc alpha-1-phosphate uridylyltransferase